MNVRIVTASDQRYRKIAAEWERHVLATGYRYSMIDLDTMAGDHGLARESADILPCLFKPRVLRLAQNCSEEFIVWLDADAFLRARIDEVFTDDYDIGVTRRSDREIAKKGHIPSIGQVNAGVIFFRNNECLPGLLREWEDRTMSCGIEQQALNELVRTTSARVKMFPAAVYNDAGLRPESKVWHYKNARKAAIDPAFRYRSPA